MNVLKLFILFFIVSAAFGVEEDEVTPELPIPNPFRIEDFQHEIVEAKNHPETSIGLRWSRTRDYRLLLSNRSPLRRFGLRGDLNISRDEDFIPTERRLFHLEIAVPMKRVWTAVGTDYYFRKRNGDFVEEKSSISSCLELGVDANDWELECFGQAGSSWMDNGRNDSQEASTHFSRRYGSAVFGVSFEWRRETAPGCRLSIGSAELQNTLVLTDRITIGGGLHCGGWDELRVYPHIRILVTPLNRFILRTWFDPKVELIGSKTYLQREFSAPGRPVEELHPFRWSSELVWLLNELNSLRGRIVIEKVDHPVIWEWDFLGRKLVPQSCSSYERRVMEVEIKGGSEGLITWQIGTRMNRSIDEEGYQIPNHPLSTTDGQIQLNCHPFTLCLGAHHCGKRFALRRERNSLKDFFVLSSSLGLKWGKFSFSLGLQNLTNKKYELLPLVFHKGREYSLEFGFTTQH